MKDSFNFANEYVEPDSGNFIESLDIDSRFNNIPLEKTIEICTKSLFKNSDIAHSLKKRKCKDLLFLATKKSYFIFNNILYRQTDAVAMESPRGSSLANACLSHQEQNWRDSCPLEHIGSYYRRFVDDIYVFFKLSDHVRLFQSYLNSCHVNMSFTIATDQNNKVSF